MGITILLVFICMVLNTVAQVFLKIAMNQIGYFSFTLPKLFATGLKIAINPWIISGLAIYALSVFIWLLVLSRHEVSVVYPLTSIAFILTALSAFFFLGESLSVLRMTGIVVIIVGIYLVTRTSV